MTAAATPSVARHVARLDRLHAHAVALVGELERMRAEVTEQARRRAPRPEEVTIAVCESLGLPVDDVMGVSRREHLVRARWAIIAVLDRVHYGQARIGRYLMRDRSTVRHGVAEAEALLRSGDEAFTRAVSAGLAVWGVATPEVLLRPR